MYKDIRYFGPVGTSPVFHRFRLTDTDFVSTFDVQPYHRGMCITGMLLEYSKRGAPITRNIARHYVNMVENYRWNWTKLISEINDDKHGVDSKKDYMFAKYVKYNCLINQIKRVWYTKHATSIA